MFFNAKNIIEHSLRIDEKKYTVIDFNKFPTKQYVMTWSFPGNISIVNEDPIFENGLEILRNYVDFFTKINGETHAFVQPRFYLKPPNELGVKIETIEKKTLEEIENSIGI